MKTYTGFPGTGFATGNCAAVFDEEVRGVALGRCVAAVDGRVSSCWDGGEVVVEDVTVRGDRKGIGVGCGGAATTGCPS